MRKVRNEDFKYQKLSQEEQKQRGILGRLVGVCADFINPTRNGRKYDEQLWENVFNDPIMKEKINNHICFGELGHPADREEVDMDKIAICLAEQPVKGTDGKLHAIFDILDTPNGRILKTLCDYGSNIGISSRGTGDLYTDSDGNESVDPDTYHCECWDAVLIPAVPEARLQYVTESLDVKKYNKTLRQRLTEELDKASEADKIIMNETLSNLDINLDEGSDTKHYICDDCGFEADLTDDEYTGKCPNCGSHHGFYAEGLNEKLVEPSEEDLKPIEDKFAELGLEVEGKGKTLFGNVHYQLRKELDHEVTKEDLGPIFDELCELGNEVMPTTCNVGVHRDGNNVISASVDVLKKHVDDVVSQIYGEELENEDGWGERIQGQLEQTFGNLEDLMYEVRNGVRGSYAINGNTVQDLVGELRDLADQLAMNADDLEFEQDNLNEDIPTDPDQQRELMGILSRINAMSGRILEYDKQYDYNSEEDKMTKSFLNNELNQIQKACQSLAKFNIKESVNKDGHSGKENVEEAFDPRGYTNVINAISDGIEDDTDTEALQDYLQNIVGYCRSIADDYDILLESVSEDGCSDKEDQVVKEKAGNSGEDLMKELQEALSKNGELEKDNLSLQEKLSVCNAKEIKLTEELNKYKKVSSNLSGTAKRVKSLEEDLEKLSSQLEYKDKLIESKNDRLSKLITFKKENISKLNESDRKISDLESRVKSLSESVSNSNKKLADTAALVKKYQRALKESRDRYIDAKASACGLSSDSIRAQLKESYNYKDIDSVCDELVEQKVNMSKLPFRLNEGVQLKAKSSQNEYIRGNRMPDDDVSDYLLSMIK